MNLFEIDEDDEKFDLYDTEPQKRNQPYEEYIDKYSRLLSTYIYDINMIETKKDMLYENSDQLAIYQNQIPQENKIGIFDMIPVGYDVMFRKVTITFSYLATEVTKIEELFRLNIYDPLILYGERPNQMDRIPEGEVEIQISRMIPHFKLMLDLSKRLIQIINNIVQQLHSLYNNNEILYKTTYKNIPLTAAFETLGTALSLLYKVDCIVQQNEYIKSHTDFFIKMLKIVRSDLGYYKTTEKQLNRFEKIFHRFSQTFLSGQCLLQILKSINTFDSNIPEDEKTKSHIKMISFKENKELYNVLIDYTKQVIKKLDSCLSTPTETDERSKIIPLFCLYSFYNALFPQEDKDIWKALWALQKKAPYIFVHQHITFSIPDFLLQICPLKKPSRSADPKNPKVFIVDYLNSKNEKLENEFLSLYKQFLSWIVKIESVITSENQMEVTPAQKILSLRAKLIISGFVLAQQIRFTIIGTLILHIRERVSTTEKNVPILCLGIEILKAIEQTILKNSNKFTFELLIRLVSYQIQQLLNPAHEKFKKVSGSKKESPEIFSALSLLISLLQGPASAGRINLLNLCVNYVSNKNVLKSDEAEDLRYLIWKFQLFSNVNTLFKEVCDISFLYWCKDLIPLFFNIKYKNPNDIKRLNFLFDAINESSNKLLRLQHLEQPESLYNEFKKEVIESFYEQYIHPLTIEIEDHTRYAIHQRLIEKIIPENPFKNQKKDYKKYLDVDAIRCFDIFIDIKYEVSKRLNQKFYNMTVLNMHDYETYEFMRSYSQDKFGFDLYFVYIPSQTLESGTLDILQIIKGINSFVLNFHYDMHNQTFIERVKENTMLKSVGIQQITDSVHTHGYGIIATSVNFVYKFILKRFNTFSQFLYDEWISSPLVREYKFFKEKGNHQGRYPYQRAENLLTEINRLGQIENGKTYMDKFRELITHVGNALGFTRLIRSASISICSKNIEYLPHNQEKFVFSEDLKNANFSESTVQIGAELDACLGLLRETFSDKSDYLRTLSKIFEGKLNFKDNKHLKIFHFIVPSLIINYIDTILIVKDNLNKKNATDLFITDDGFAIGLAYFLKILNLNHKFDSLHWFEEIQEKFNSDKKRLQKDLDLLAKNKKTIDEIDMASQISLRRIIMLTEEYETFNYCFNGARILFREE